MSSQVDINWLRNELIDRTGLSKSEIGDLICAAMVTGNLTGLAPLAQCYPKTIVRTLSDEIGPWKNFEIPVAFWNCTEIDWDCQNPCFHFHIGDNIWIVYSILLDRATAYDFLKSRDPALQALQAALLKSSFTPKDRIGSSGRPPKYNWSKCIIEAVRWMEVNGRPKTLAELVNYMAEWFEPEEPGDTQLKQYLGPIYQNFEPKARLD
ncbi:hypothetical protein MKK84_18680 [Methylobacterium sp. E-065]|uniref:hypothetical protein n=1 Tax=Methylobacterium sp. E-065 TaxID=2836583 RepID=UPI001FBB1E70|nr:hypothetical protein [Methylobacterium sp. E-065]MCJ2019437.1 hypothetical protein [Methylobacterium sp. E-065]